MNRSKLLITIVLGIVVVFGIAQTSWQQRADLNGAAVNLAETRPIPIRENLWMEELTWMEVRDLVDSGYSTVILPTGGIEQNGPNVITGKHNKVVEVMSDAIARKLGQTLIAPVVKFVPEGNHNPPTGHMRYPGTLGLTEKTYRNMLREICLSLKLHGFETIVLLGDSGGNQAGMEKVTNELNKEWSSKLSPRVIYAKNYYFQDEWSFNYLKSIGIHQLPDVKSAQRNDVHSDYHYESILAAANPDHIRAEERQENGTFSINGASLLPLRKTVENGKLLIEYRAQLTADDIRTQRLQFASPH